MYIEDPNPSTTPLKVKPLMTLGLFVATVASVLVGLIPLIYENVGVSAQSWIQLFSH